MFIPLAQGRGILASFPGSTLRNVNIEVVQAIHIRVPGEPGNEARAILVHVALFPG